MSDPRIGKRATVTGFGQPDIEGVVTNVQQVKMQGHAVTEITIQGAAVAKTAGEPTEPGGPT